MKKLNTSFLLLLLLILAACETGHGNSTGRYADGDFEEIADMPVGHLTSDNRY